VVEVWPVWGRAKADKFIYRTKSLLPIKVKTEVIFLDRKLIYQGEILLSKVFTKLLPE
jgi:hypothetical protein